jgi:hypothetical protein
LGVRLFFSDIRFAKFFLWNRSFHKGRKIAMAVEPTDDRMRADRANTLTQTRNQILTEGFKGLVLINGGGAGALAVFLQAILDKPVAAGMMWYLLIGIASLLVGTALAAILFLARYLSFFHPNTNILIRNPWWWTTIVLVMLSLACFLFGMGAAVWGGFVALL